MENTDYLLLEIKRLRDHNHELEMNLIKLREAVQPRIFFPEKWKLSRGETDILASLYSSPTGFRSFDLLAACIEIFDKQERGWPRLRSRAFVLRGKLKKYGIEILSRRDEGYVLPKPSKDIIATALTKE